MKEVTLEELRPGDLIYIDHPSTNDSIGIKTYGFFESHKPARIYPSVILYPGIFVFRNDCITQARRQEVPVKNYNKYYKMTKEEIELLDLIEGTNIVEELRLCVLSPQRIK